MFLAIFEGMTPSEWLMVALWGVVFVTTLVVELCTANLTTIWFCVASALTLICAALQVNPGLQVIIFVFLSLVLVFATRPLTKKMMNTEIVHTNSDKVIGMIGIVTKDIVEDEIGEIKVDNNLWRAVSLSGDAHVGEKVSVVSISGNKVVVSKAATKNGEENIIL